MRKKCYKCSVEKDVCEFHKQTSSKDGYMGICKDCRKPIDLEYVTKNKELISYKRTKKYYLNHEENLIKDRNRIKSERVKRNEYSKTYYQNNKEKIKEYRQEYYKLNNVKIKEKARVWEKNNKVRRNKSVNERIKIRKKEDVLFKLKTKLKTDIYISLKRKTRSKKLEQIIGLGFNEYKRYIENQFESWMSWDNWGLHTWHIDHIVPLSFAKTEEEIYLLWHYTNLRPISAKENLVKSNKIYGK
jgi:hypothetical protein